MGWEPPGGKGGSPNVYPAPARAPLAVSDAYFIMDELDDASPRPLSAPAILIDYGGGAAGYTPSPAYGRTPPHPPGSQPSVAAPSAPPLYAGASVAIAKPIAQIERRPMRVFCPQCGNAVETRTALRVGTMSWLCAVALLPAAFVCGCLLPFCLPWFKDVHHTCPSCRAEIAVHRRL